MVSNDDAQVEHPGVGQMVTATGDVAVASGMVRFAEDLLAQRQQRRVSEVRLSLARRIRTSPSTLRHIRNQRRKDVPNWLMAAIRRMLIEVLQGEVRRLQHEINIHLQTGADARGNALAKAQAQVVEAQKALSEALQ